MKRRYNSTLLFLAITLLACSNKKTVEDEMPTITSVFGTWETNNYHFEKWVNDTLQVDTVLYAPFQDYLDIIGQLRITKDSLFLIFVSGIQDEAEAYYRDGDELIRDNGDSTEVLLTVGKLDKDNLSFFAEYIIQSGNSGDEIRELHQYNSVKKQ